MSFEVRTEFGNLDPEAKRALVAMQHAIKGHLDEQEKRNRRPKRSVTELVEEGSVIAKPGQVVRVQPSDADIEVVLPPSDPGNGGEDVIVSFEGDGTAVGKVVVTPMSGTCANPGTTTLNTPGSYRFTSTGAPSEGELAETSNWSGPAPLSLEDLPEIGSQKLLGNNTGVSATPTELSASQVLDWVDSTRGTIPYRGASAWAGLDPGVIELPIVSKGAGVDPVYQQLATAGIQDDAVTNAKLGNMAQATVKLRATGAGTGDPTDGTATQVLDMIGTTRGSLLERGASAWGAITPGTTELPLVSKGAGADPIYQLLATAGIADDAVTNAKAANMAQATIKLRASGAGTGDPTDGTVTQALDMAGSTRGSLLERGASTWGVITPGTTGLPLVSQGSGADPIYTKITSTGSLLGWDDVLVNDAHSGTTKPIIDASQYLECHTSDATQFLRVGDVGLGESFSVQAGTSSGASVTSLGVVGKTSLDLRNGLATASVHIEDDGTNAVRLVATGARFIKVESSVGLRINNGALNTSGVLSVRQSPSSTGCPITPTADDGCFWVRGDTPSAPMFQTDSDVSIPLRQCFAQKTTSTNVSAATTVLACTGTHTIPADTLVVGSRFRVTFAYRFVRGGTATALNLGSFLNVGGSSISTALAAQTAAGTYHLRVEAEFTVLTTGAGGTAMAVLTTYGTASTATGSISTVEDIALAIDTTSAVDVSGTAQMNTAVASTSIRALGGHVEWLN